MRFDHEVILKYFTSRMVHCSLLYTVISGKKSMNKIVDQKSSESTATVILSHSLVITFFTSFTTIFFSQYLSMIILQKRVHKQDKRHVDVFPYYAYLVNVLI